MPRMKSMRGPIRTVTPANARLLVYVCKKHGETDCTVYVKKTGHVERHCKLCRKEWRDARPTERLAYMAQWRDENRSKINEDRRRETRARKWRIIEAYGGACVCCGQTQPDFLAIDHIDQNGKAHREEVGNSGNAMYQWLEKNGYPKDNHRLLCHNCNFARNLNDGVCPHEFGRLQIVSTATQPEMASV